MSTRTCCAALLVLGLANVGCGAKLDGDWDGDLDLVSVSADLGTKGPVHVHVSGDTFTLVGAPFTKCAVKLEKGPGGPTLHFEGGNCSVQGGGKPPTKTFAFPDGYGWVTVKGKKLEASYTPPVGGPGTVDVAFQLSATRATK